MAKSETFFCPEAINFANLSEIIARGRWQILQSNRCSHLVVDMKNSEYCDSATICLLIDFLRLSKSRLMTMQVRNVSQQLRCLLTLYKLTDLVPAAD